LLCMNTKTFLIAVAALIIGSIGGYTLGQDGAPNQRVSEDTMMHGEMNAMTAALEGKIGEEFDRAFLSEMILHHEGAVDMAEAALIHAGHEEIKEMARAIITAQTAEIGQMRDWQTAWYGQ